MNKLSAIVFFYFVFHWKAVAQSQLPPVFVINSDTTAFADIPNQHWQVLKDKEGAWTIEQVRNAPVAAAFHHVENLPYDNAATVYWFRFRLRNAMNKEVKVGLFGKNERVDYYLQYAGGRQEHKVCGWAVPWSQREGFRAMDYIPFVLKPGEEIVVYKRVYNSYRFPVFSDFSVKLGFTDRAVQQQFLDDESRYFSTIHNSFNFGFLLFAGLFTLFFFFIVREKVYLYFAVYVFLLGAGRFEKEWYDLFFREHPLVWAHLMWYVFWTFTIFFQTHFIRHLLKTPAYTPRLDRLLFALTIVAVVATVGLYFLPPLSPKGWNAYVSIGQLSQAAVVLTALLAFFLALRKQRWSNKILPFAIFPAFCVWGLLFATHKVLGTLTFVWGLIPFWPFTQWLFESWFLIETICLGWQVLFFSWLLLHRFSEQRRQITQLALEKERERSELINRQKTELEQQVAERTAELKRSLQELKDAQTQLVQSEKMASLGELTAGIAHEIQNPLNFVNNFSETNAELLEELVQANKTGNQQEVEQLAKDIKENEQKIFHHGKRADAIVKNMLQHSRKSDGTKEPTDINALANEYLRLSYQGFRAKNKTFTAVIQTDFDRAIGKVAMVPQDMGRVLLNLYNNAFYSVAEKKQQLDGVYEPTVTVTTKKQNNKIQITVHDNGAGIPQKIVDKIFQPFFTTKPAGEGTGLGLSLAYDIVTKGHGAELKVETKEGEGATFIISLPAPANTDT